MNPLAVIPARSGSKRLPGKNMKPFAGKPLIHWTIAAALESGEFETVVVSTDSEEIARYSESIGAIARPLRPKQYSTDSSSSSEVVSYVLRKFPDHNTFALLQPTSPLRFSNHIREALSLMVEGCKSVVSAEIIDLDSEVVIPVARENTYFRVCEGTKEAKPIHARLNGAIYVMERELFERDKTFLRGGTRIYPMSRANSIDIDTVDDFMFAEQLFLLQRRA